MADWSDAWLSCCITLGTDAALATIRAPYRAQLHHFCSSQGSQVGWALDAASGSGFFLAIKRTQRQLLAQPLVRHIQLCTMKFGDECKLLRSLLVKCRVFAIV